MTEKVVYLAYSHKEAATESTTFLACANCKNKTFSIVYENESEIPRMKCGACGWNGGRIGFLDE
jgi:hypothetical protein